MFVQTEINYSVTSFEIWDLVDPTAPIRLNQTNLPDQVTLTHLSSNYKTLYLRFPQEISVLDLSNKSCPRITKSYQINDEPFNLALSSFVATSNEKTLIATARYKADKTLVEAFSLSDSLDRIWTLNISFKEMLLKDDQTLIFIGDRITFYNISDSTKSPVEITSVPIVLDPPGVLRKFNSAQLSLDRKTLSIQFDEMDNLFRLQIYDISRTSSPYILSEYTLSKTQSRTRQEFITLAPDLKSGFMYQDGSLLKIKLLDQKQIKVSAIIPLSSNTNVPDFTISPDGQTIYISRPNSNEINIVSTQIKNTLYLKQDKFLLGQRSSENIGMLSRNDAFDYDLMDKNSFKIIELSLLDIQIDSEKNTLDLVESLLPSWMEFDQKKNVFTLEPRNQKDLGTYTLQSAVSMKIPDDAFDDLGVSSEDLVAWLISLGYIDNQLFLTESFATIESSYSSSGSLKTFYLPAQFKPYQKQIYDVLKIYYSKTCTGIEILSSLDVDENLAISTPRPNYIKVDIDLISPPESQTAFVHSYYGPLSSFVIENKQHHPRLHLEGSLKDINAALQSIVVDFENEEYCDANITIHDNFNKPLMRQLTNISRLFIANQPPTLNQQNQTMQRQIDTTDIYTGQHFSIDLKEIFRDNYSEQLNYELVMANNDTTGVPKWLSVNGLRLQGSPPEEVLQDLELVLIVKNEFKQLREPFKLHVRISLVFFFKLLLRYGSYVISLLGLLISLNKILNIVTQKTYKHPKEYMLNIGEKISSETISPIFFVRKEKQELEFIIKHLEKYISNKLQLKSLTRSNIVDYFIDSDSQELDKQQILNTIQTIVSQLPFEIKEKELSSYCSAQNSKKSLIQQIALDRLTLWQLDQNKETKSVFKKVKDKWVNMITWDTSLSKFTLTENKFEKIVEDTISHSQLSSSQFLTKSELQDDSTIALTPGINLSLLRDSILAYAFQNHQINMSPVQVEVSMKEQVKTNFILTILKYDLMNVHKIKYGIKYHIADGQLNFSGFAKHDLEAKTLVVQIATTKNRILKEIFIRGAPKSLANQEAIAIFSDPLVY